MKTALLGIWLALSAGPALGWSEDWNNYDPTNDFGKPTGRMFMELVWAVNERIAAAKSAGCDHFYESGGVNMNTIFPGTPGNPEAYVGIQTNWSDEIGDYVAETCALYRAEFWEPNAAQVDQLVQGAYEVFGYFMPADTASFAHRFSPYVGATNADPNVPVWVYKRANILGNYINGTNYGSYTNVWNQPQIDVAMHMPWPSNPIAILGGRMVYAGDDGNIPAYLIDYPVHESPPGTTLTNQLINQYVVRESAAPGTPWELHDPLAETNLFGGFLNYRSELGTYDCAALEIRWAATNGWWTNTTFTFDIRRATTANLSTTYYGGTRLEDWVSDPGISYHRYANEIWTVNELYPTNVLTVSGTLPMDIACSNFVPTDVEMTDGSLFTGIVPNVTAKVLGIRPVGDGTGGASGSEFRSWLSDWNSSVSRLFKIKETIDLHGSNTVAMAGVSLLSWKYWSTNSGTYWNDPDHIQCWDCLYPVGYGTNTTLNYTNYPCQAYDYAQHGWTNSGSYGSPQGNGLDENEAARVNAYCHLENDTGLFTGYRSSKSYCANVEVSSSYVEDRLPTDDGYPYIEAVDYYVSLTNQVHDYYDGYVTNTRAFLGTATYGATHPIVRGYGGGGSWVSGHYLNHTGMIFNVNDQWMTDLNATSEYAWANGPYSCEGSSNETTKSLNSMIKFSVSGIAKWRFSTNFDAYWEMYPACTNGP